ncbi:acyl-CoA dehydrogenase family protein [Nocardia sp. NPDC006630]|uniref:acyl-CoA dehydrogenase family protein n=1 Tax=Nocardia sp. NPDC006630 TaxID=3157181 RepID=UPI0033BC7A70
MGGDGVVDVSVDWTRAAELLVEQVLDRHAAEVDRSGVIPEANFEALAAGSFYDFVLSEGMTPQVLIDTAATIIGGCLSTGFLWAQHLGALRSVAFADNTQLRDTYLPQMRTGRYRCGVSYAGARSTPTLFAELDAGSYTLTGSAPFVTGWGYIDALVTSARVRCSAGDSVATLLIPVQDIDGVSAERMTLIAADASATVRLLFDGARIPSSLLIGATSIDTFGAGRGGTLVDWVNGALPLGVLSRCLRQLKDLGVESTSYEAQFIALRARFASALGDAEATYSLRAAVAEAAVVAATAGVVAAGSTATMAGSTAERLMRQATFALVCTTREPIKNALLERLAPADLRESGSSQPRSSSR